MAEAVRGRGARAGVPCGGAGSDTTVGGSAAVRGTAAVVGVDSAGAVVPGRCARTTGVAVPGRSASCG